MNHSWWDRVVESVADRGREILKLKTTGTGSGRIADLCDALLSSAGVAAGMALAREIVRAFDSMSEDERTQFFETLLQRFGPSRESILAAAEAYRQNGDDLKTYLALNSAVEPPRQELFRRINQAPNGIATLVRMREHLLRQLKERPHLRAVDADLRHLLSSWFNPGFLRLELIDWSTSASILEKLISFEAVHAIRDWDDLHRRLEADRRCFAFFHPALPGEPLIFVEVALVKGMASAAAPLLAHDAPVLDPDEADAAIFYSINNCQFGLRGVSFGNFLIKQVMSELMLEFPGIKRFATLSPLPRFAEALKAGDQGPFTVARLNALLEDDAEALCARAQVDDAPSALQALLADVHAHSGVLSEPLQRLALAYLALAKRRGNKVYDPVAQFHLSNGAQLERINAFADSSDLRMGQSFGVMVNYRYEPNEVERNHEMFVNEGVVPMSRVLAREARRLESRWNES